MGERHESPKPKTCRCSCIKRAPCEVDDGYDMDISCIDGCIWITQDGDPRDIVLGTGESFRFDRPGVALVHAFVSSVIVLPRGAWADMLTRESGFSRPSAYFK